MPNYPNAMAEREQFLARLLELPSLQDANVRRAVLRQTLVTLGHGRRGPLALAGVDPRALARSVQVVIGDSLLDDIDFIEPAAAAVAVYQLASALPLGSERRTLGRKVFAYLYNGNAATFAALASRMALGALKPLSGAGIHARVALAMQLPVGEDAAVDRMALAFVGRRELAQSWVNQGAMLGLPQRRLAAQLMERAARAAARRDAAGDAHPLRLFRAVHNPGRLLSPPRPDADVTSSFATAWHALLAEREALVWRHVAIARGLLSAAVDELAHQVRRALDLSLSPTEWRRAATSMVARIAVDRERGLSEALALLDGPITRRDPGLPLAMVWGLGPVAEVEPEAAEELLQELADHSPISIADGLVELRRHVPGIGDKAAARCVAALRQSLATPERDDGLTALASSIIDDLEGRGGSPLANSLRQATTAFAQQGTEAAYGAALEALRLAQAGVGVVEGLDVHYRAGVGAEARQRTMKSLRELHIEVLQRRTLSDLLLLDRAPGSEALGVEAVDDLEARLGRWLLDPQRRKATSEEVTAQLTLQQLQLRVLLHVVDSSATDFPHGHERRPRVRARWRQVVHTLSEHVRSNPATPLRRALIATIARASDALVRDGAAEAVDVFMYMARRLTGPEQLSVVAEASMNPDVERLLRGYLGFVRASEDQHAPAQSTKLAALRQFLDAFPSHITLRSEAFRTTALRLLTSLEHILQARALQALGAPDDQAAEDGPLATLEQSISQLDQLVIGAERHCGEVTQRSTIVSIDPTLLGQAVHDATFSGNSEALMEVITAVVRAAEAALPVPMASLVREVLPHAASLPAHPEDSRDSRDIPSRALPLPDWLPNRRILGGFYVIRQLGGGNVGTVFVVTRAEERHNDNAETFALKVPEFDATAARTMSEAEFLKLFREEAGALLSIPEHPNVARFVTFDVGAKPKPILVMELVEGVALDRVLSRRQLGIAQVVRLLDGVLAGLEAMHACGIAHLDVKPSNIIMRSDDELPVLVDFGLAGRNIRPGCATLCYGAPEIWEATPSDANNTPAPAADIYALGCMAYEMFTDNTLFDGPSDVAIIAQHLKHDGLPAPVQRLAQHPHLQSLAMFLHQCLRHDPTQRGSVATVRDALKRLAPELARLSWPLTAD